MLPLNFESIFTWKSFVEWVQNQPKGAIVGNTADSESCPIAECIKGRFGFVDGDISVDCTEATPTSWVNVHPKDSDEYNQRLFEDIQFARFITVVDQENAITCSRERALEIIQEIENA